MFKKRFSRITERAAQRIAAIKSIDPELDLGNGITVAAFQTLIADTDAALETYNTQLSITDNAKSRLAQNEKDLRVLTERVLVAVAAKYGKDSYEYEKAGGTRLSKRRRPRRSVAVPSS